MKLLDRYPIKSIALALIAFLIGIFIALDVVGPVLDNSCVIQDDFRQTHFWFWRFWDPGLFPNDFFADNFQNTTFIAPIYVFIWKLMPLFFDDMVYASKFYAVVLTGFSSLAAYLFMMRLINNRSNCLALAFALGAALAFDFDLAFAGDFFLAFLVAIFKMI